MNDRRAKTVYEPLDKSRQQFRVLEIAEPGDCGEDSQVVVTIHTVALQDSPSFTALSYVWGDPMDTVEIIVNGSPRKVTRNLSEALKHVSKHAILHMNQRGNAKCDRQAFRLWADALCINQEDVEERSHQVGLMGRIYSSASLVVAWLSNDDKGLPLLFSALEALCEEVDLVHAGDVDALYGVTWMESHENPLFRLAPADNEIGEGPIALAMCRLCELTYWQRVWIVQEIALSRDLIYTTPSARIHRPTFERSLRYLIHLASKNWGGGMYTKDNERPKTSSLLSAFFWIGIYKHVPSMMSFDRILDKQFESLSITNAKSSGNCATHSASLSLKGFQHDATDARDHVYGLLGLTGLSIVPDYTKTTQQVLFDYVQALIDCNRGTGSELCFLDTAPKALHKGTNDSDIPSWMPSRFRFDCCRADRPCHATRSVFRDSNDLPEPRVHERSLFAGGSRIQQIKRFIEIPDIDHPGRAIGKTWCDILEDVASGGRTAYHTGCSMPRALWSTVLCKTDGDADTSPFLAYFEGGYNVEENYRTMTSMVQKFPGLWAHLQEDLRHLRDGIDNKGLSDVLDSHMMTVNVNWKHMLKRTREAVELFETEEGYFGVGPKGCTVQDEVCILKDCASPLLLRPRPGECHSVVGPCFVLGLMDGEAKTFLQEGRCKTRIFELV